MKYKAYLTRRYSVFFSLLISYVLILLIPVVFSGGVFFITSKTIEDEINSSNKAMLKQIQTSVDYTLQDVEKLGIDITFNPKIQKIALLKEEIQESDRYIIHEIHADFARAKMTNGYINDFFIFFKDIDCILSSNSFGESEIMYKILAHEDNIKYEDWHDMLTNTYARNYRSFVYGKGLEKDRAIAYMQPLSSLTTGLTRAVVVILIDEARINKMIENLYGVNQGDVLVLNKENEVLAANRSSNIYDLQLLESLKNKEGIYHEKQKGEDLTVSVITSEITGFKYVSVIPQSIYSEKSNHTKRLMTFSILLCMIVGCAAAYILTRKKNRPVDELVASLKHSDRQFKLSKDYNEYTFIGEELRNTIQEKTNVVKKYEQQMPIVRSDFLIKLLKGKIGYKTPVNDMLSSAGISFYSDYFAVVLLYIEDPGDLFPVNTREELADSLKTLNFVLMNVFGELIGRHHQSFMTEVDDMLGALINLRTDSIGEGNMVIGQACREAQKFLSENFHIRLSISISNIHQMLDGISEAYEEACEAMEYKIIMGTGKIVNYMEIETSHQSYFYPLETEDRLIKCIKAGDFEAASKILDEIFKNNFLKHKPSIQIAKCLMFDLISTVIKTIDEIGNMYRSPLWDKVKPVGKLLECETISEMKNLMECIFDQVCNQVKEELKGSDYKLSDRVKEHITSHYNDVNLSVSAIADQFEVTPNYLSRLFKEQTGDGLLDYINKVRMEKAKQFIKEEKLSISDIALKVGYSNRNTLMRVFKKYEGLTISQYKSVE